MALLTKAQIDTIQRRLANPQFNVAFALNDLGRVLADHEARTRLLREVLAFEEELDHVWNCAAIDKEMGLPCGCGRDALLAQIREAVKA